MTRIVHNRSFGAALTLLVGCGGAHCGASDSRVGGSSASTSTSGAAVGGSSGAGACTKHEDCGADRMCVTLTHCAQGHCNDIPEACKNTVTCGCIQQPICGADSCIDHGQCFACTSPPAG